MSTWWEESVYKNPEIYLKVVDRNIGDKVEDKQQKRKDGYEKAIGNGTCPMGKRPFDKSGNVQFEQVIQRKGILRQRNAL